MIRVAPLTDSTNLIGNPEALRERWQNDGVLFMRGVLDPELIGWARGKYRDVLVSEGLIVLENETPLWTGKEPRSRNPCNALGTEVWREIVKQPALNQIVRNIFEGEPVWIPIAQHRSGMPSGPVEKDIFSGRHQDGFFNEGMNFLICWIPMRDITMNSGSFAVAPGTHKNGTLHVEGADGTIPAGVIPDEAWRAADFKVGDVLIFSHLTAHATLPNPSNEIRMSLDVRAIPEYAPQPVVGTVELVENRDVTIRRDEGGVATVRVSDTTFIRDMHPHPRIPTGELGRIAYPGARVMAMAHEDGIATVLRSFAY